MLANLALVEGGTERRAGEGRASHEDVMIALAAVQPGGGAGVPPGLFHRIGAFLTEHRLGADPQNYAFAYAVVSEPDGDLARSVARITDGGVRLSGQDIALLGGTAAAGKPVVPEAAAAATAGTPAPVAGDAAVAADALIARAQYQVAAFNVTMRTMREEAHGFGRHLAASAAAFDARAALPGIDEVIRLTSAMLTRVRESEARLEQATREAEELRAALDEARGSARRDPLTELPNRRAFDEGFAAIRGAAAIAMLDVDHFKQVNDRLGHAVGDRVLRAIAQALAAGCPDCLVARFGGEEFVILAPVTVEAMAEQVERVRAQIASKRFRVRGTDENVGTITLSAGIAAIVPGESAEAAVRRVDAALYRAKSSGRNRLEFAPQIGAIDGDNLADFAA